MAEENFLERLRLIRQKYGCESTSNSPQLRKQASSNLAKDRPKENEKRERIQYISLPKKPKEVTEVSYIEPAKPKGTQNERVQRKKFNYMYHATLKTSSYQFRKPENNRITELDQRIHERESFLRSKVLAEYNRMDSLSKMQKTYQELSEYTTKQTSLTKNKQINTSGEQPRKHYENIERKRIASSIAQTVPLLETKFRRQRVSQQKNHLFETVKDNELIDNKQKKLESPARLLDHNNNEEWNVSNLERIQQKIQAILRQ